MQDKQGKGRLPAYPRVIVAPRFGGARTALRESCVRKMATQPARVDRIWLTEPERHPLHSEKYPRRSANALATCCGERFLPQTKGEEGDEGEGYVRRENPTNPDFSGGIRTAALHGLGFALLSRLSRGREG